MWKYGNVLFFVLVLSDGMTLSQMFVLHFEESLNQNDLELCEECYARGLPPPGADNLRAWPSTFELVVTDLRHPHVVLGPHLSEIAQHHAAAHRTVALDMAVQLNGWGFDATEYDDTSDALMTMMRRFRSAKPVVVQMVQTRMQHVAEACAYQGPLNFAKANVQKLKQLDCDVGEVLCSAEFHQQVQLIVQSSGSLAERGTALENAIADKECEVLALHGLTPDFQGVLHRSSLQAYVLETCATDVTASELIRASLAAKMSLRQRLTSYPPDAI